MYARACVCGARWIYFYSKKSQIILYVSILSHTIFYCLFSINNILSYYYTLYFLPFWKFAYNHLFLQQYSCISYLFIYCQINLLHLNIFNWHFIVSAFRVFYFAQIGSNNNINSTDFKRTVSPQGYCKVNMYHTRNDRILMDRYR